MIMTTILFGKEREKEDIMTLTLNFSIHTHTNDAEIIELYYSIARIHINIYANNDWLSRRWTLWTSTLLFFVKWSKNKFNLATLCFYWTMAKKHQTMKQFSALLCKVLLATHLCTQHTVPMYTQSLWYHSRFTLSKLCSCAAGHLKNWYLFIYFFAVHLNRTCKCCCCLKDNKWDSAFLKNLFWHSKFNKFYNQIFVWKAKCILRQ